MKLDLAALGVGYGLRTIFGGVMVRIANGPISPDNTCGITSSGGSPNAYECPTNLPCCSASGYCGSTGDYCDLNLGCQITYGTCNEAAGEPPNDPDRCGPGVGSCAVGKCCSLSGYCGTTPGRKIQT